MQTKSIDKMPETWSDVDNCKCGRCLFMYPTFAYPKFPLKTLYVLLERWCIQSTVANLTAK